MLREAGLRATKAIAAGLAFEISGAAFNNLLIGNFDMGAVVGVSFSQGGKDVIELVGRDLWEKNVQGYLNGYLTQPASQLEVESPYITALRSTPANKPIVSIWGNEDYPMCFRMLSVALRTNQIPTDPLDESPDGEMVHWAKTWQNVCIAAKYTHVAMGFFRGIMGIVNVDPRALQDVGYHVVGASAWAEGENYLDTGAENDYRHIIGATWVETVRQKRDQFYYSGKNKIKIPSLLDIEGDPKAARDKWDFGYQELHFLHEDKADAFIPHPSQIAVVNLTQSYEALGAGHLEQGNHPAVRLRLQEIFARQNDPEFFTPERP